MCATRLVHACNLIRSLVSDVHSCLQACMGTCCKIYGFVESERVSKICALLSGSPRAKKKAFVWVLWW